MSRGRRGRAGARAVGVLALAAATLLPTTDLLPGAAEASADTGAQSSCPWVGENASPDARADQVVAAMTTPEKAEMLSLHYGPSGYENTAGPIPRLCVPMLTLQDGPAGVAAGLVDVTQLPAPIALAATWDPELATAYGTVEGRDARGKGVDVLQGPMVDIARVPQSGRVYEAYGEDPFLTTQMADADIAGIQSQGVMAMVKHLVANNQETDRLTINETIDERTLHEIYLPPFQATLTGSGAAAAMCAYPQINGVFACQSSSLLTDLTKGTWGFPGFVRSDLGAVHDLAAAFNAGTDQVKPLDPQALVDLVSSGAVPIARVDDAVHRVLRQMFAYGLFDNPPAGSATADVTTPQDADVALTVAERSAVLLRNNAVLPLSGLQRIAVAGPGASASVVTAGYGTARVVPTHVVTPLAAIRKRAGVRTRVSYSAATLDSTHIKAAAAAAAHSNAAIVFVGTADGEGADRATLALPPAQDRLVRAVAAANPHTVVVVNSGGPVLMPWLSRVAAVVEAWYPGQESGTALAQLLFGDVGFSGHLPVTFPVRDADTPVASPYRWPGVNGVASYGEGLQVGYRWYLHQRITPLFPFGWGLGYTTFRFTDLKVTPAADGGATVQLTVRNTGVRPGIATPQVYLRFPPAVDEPSRELAGFTSVWLAPGRSRRVTVSLPPDAFDYWDVGSHAMVRAPGRFAVFVGTSARNAALTQVYEAPSF